MRCCSISEVSFKQQSRSDVFALCFAPFLVSCASKDRLTRVCTKIDLHGGHLTWKTSYLPPLRETSPRHTCGASADRTARTRYQGYLEHRTLPKLELERAVGMAPILVGVTPFLSSAGREMGTGTR